MVSNKLLAEKEAELRLLAGSLAPGNPYLPATARRIARTLAFAEEHRVATTSQIVAEIGPGLLIMSEIAAGRSAVALGLFGASGNKILEQQNIPLAEFDLNGGAIPETYKGRIDVLYFCEVLEHLNRWPIDVLTDVKELLSPDGVLILTTPNVCRLTTRVRLISGKTPFPDYFERVGDGHNHIREYGLEEVEYYCQKAGLTVSSAEYWSLYPNSLSGRVAAAVATLFPKTSNFLAVAAKRQKP